MKLYRLAKLIIKLSFALVGLMFLYELYEAYRLSEKQPFAIYTDPAYFYLHCQKYKNSGFYFKNFPEGRSGVFKKSEVVAYNYRGTKFLIKNLAGELSSQTPPGTVILVNDQGLGILSQFSNELTEDAFLSYTASTHWLSFLFDNPSGSVKISEIVDSYIPKDKWVVSDNPFVNESSNLGARFTYSTFQINDNVRDYEKYLSSFRNGKSDLLNSDMASINYWPSTKLAVEYKGERRLLEATRPAIKDSNLSFVVINAASPNKWSYVMRNGKKFYYKLTVNDPNVTILYDNYAYTIEEVFNKEDDKEFSYLPLQN